MWREETSKRRGFLKFAENAFKSHLVSDKTKQLAVAKTTRVLTNLSRISNKLDFSTANAFDKWKTYLQYKKAEDQALKAKTKINENIAVLKKKFDSLNKRKEDLDNDLKDLKKRKKEQQEYLKDLEQEKQSREYEHLEKQVKMIEAENQDLREKLGSTQNNVGSFIAEMSTLLDLNDIQAILQGSEAGLMRYEYDNFGGDTDEFYPLESHVQHAGTGGSSKIKSRPSRKRGTHQGN